ncbi:ComEC/Rec2 family competence protein [Desulfosporosinus sp. PR]|uniref:ComEC/Rec2 family competence protein n=1 Tax=Candidatus Desulfosporosinus nitrosoreducens TaxID=3401928 RepID=UPI0027F11E3A|nr:ComEC/Rec2 family competence protein [Desulfosporosinus sp. PR]MDQ7092268.1 ComEC/Rec2 family competence protein [Desulfosporosinus sp. PR]
MKDPWIGRSASLLGGGLCGAFLPEQLRVWVLGVLFLLGVRLLFWRPRDFFGKVYRPEILLLSASFLLGFMYGAFAEGALPEPLTLDNVEISGVLKDWNPGADKSLGILMVEDADRKDDGQSKTGYDPQELERELKGQTYRLTVYANKLGQIPGEWQRVQPGDHLRFSARLERPKPVGTPGAFDLRLYNGVRGLSGNLTVKGDAEFLLVGRPSLTWKIRQKVRSRLAAWDPQETGVLEGILFGDSSRIPDEVQERYKVTGVLHVFAASGSNVAFVMALAWMVLVFTPKPARIGGSILALFFYAVLCGGSAPVVRATVLGVALLLGRLGRGQVSALRWLFLAGTGLFILNPLIIRDLGFQLSFSAAWGLVVLTPLILQKAWLGRLPVFLRYPLASTMAAQLATLPLLITAFHRLSLIGLIVNVFILFILGSVLEVGLIGVISSFSWWLCAPFFQASLWLLTATNEILKVLAGCPYADVWVINPGWLFEIVWYGGIGIIVWGKERLLFLTKVRLLYLKRRLEALAPGIALGIGGALPRLNNEENPRHDLCGLNHWYWRLSCVLVLVLLLWSPWNSPAELEVDLIDVGQGDAILIRTPQKHAILLDAGPRNEQFDAGERIVLPYLLQTGIGHLDAALITHEHQDHIGGIRAVVGNIPTDWIGVPDVGERLDSEEWKAGLPVGLTSNSPELKTLRTGDRIELDSGAWLDVLGPQQVLHDTHSDPNNNSLVMKLNYLGQNVFLTADMEQEEMEELAAAEVDLETDVFKEPHHGSRFSLDKPWLDSIHPRAVLISVGKNTFGHPAPEVLQYWEDRHIPVYRTDEQGTIKVLLREGDMEIIAGRPDTPRR